MVLTVKPLPNASDSNKQGEGHDLKPKTVMNSSYFWDNYCKFHPILKVNKILYLGRWTFVELHHFQDKLEENGSFWITRCMKAEPGLRQKGSDQKSTKLEEYRALDSS